MLPNELIALVDDVRHLRCERQNIELKRSLQEAPRKLYDTLSSFSNQSGGGIIIFGISEQDNYAVTGVNDPQAVQIQVNNQAKQMIPVVRPVFTVAEIENKIVVSAEIAECALTDKPCYYAGAGRLKGSYVRVGESDEPMTEAEIYNYEAFRQKIHAEKEPVSGASMSDLGEDNLAEYLISLRRQKDNLAQLPREKILKLQGIAVDGVPTVAGLMLLGEYPQAFFPQLCITAMVIAGSDFSAVGALEERFIDNKRIEGTIPQMLESAEAFIWRNTRTATVVKENGVRADKPEYPHKAVRELILNALVHRDYSTLTSNIPIRIMLFPDRLEIENPGGLYGHITIDTLGTTAADTRNPFLAGAMEILQKTENRFSGIPTVYAEMAKAGLLPPLFESKRNVFKATLYNEGPLPLNDKLNINGTGNDAPRYSANEALLLSRILEFCAEPHSREEIARHLQLNSPYYISAKYLRPLIAGGQLKMTLPERPKSKKQKYVTNH